MQSRTVAVLAVGMLVLGTAACGGDDSTDEAAPAADCVDATKMGPAIAKGASGSKITPAKTEAVQSESSGVYYLAMDFTIDGDEETGVWVATDLDPNATSILSVDAMAKTVTRWPDAEKAHDISYPNENTDAAEACLS